MGKKYEPRMPRDVAQQVTDSIVVALETAGEWSRPWARVNGGAAAPRSVEGRAYRGVNAVLLWASAMDAGYETGTWGTYKAWQGAGAQVRKGEKGTMVTLWRPVSRPGTAAEITNGETDGRNEKRCLLLRHFTVFAAEQVDGWTAPAVETFDPIARDARVDAFFAAVGADVRYGGDRAYYTEGLDRIQLPPADAFVSADAFYCTAAHEHTHWTGHASRLNRNLSGRFGSDHYAAEELVAELSAAFLGAHLGYSPEVRDDHAAYVRSWVKVLKDDKRAIFTAASKAQQATDYLIGLGAGAACELEDCAAWR